MDLGAFGGGAARTQWGRNAECRCRVPGCCTALPGMRAGCFFCGFHADIYAT